MYVQGKERNIFSLKQVKIKHIVLINSKLTLFFEYLQVIGCDGTEVNAGVHTGVIRRLELHLNRTFNAIFAFFIYFIIIINFY